ncbi:MAG TPA: glutamyl-tRNA reductase [Pantanalinema sp.]
MFIHMIGLSHRTAPVAVRERVAVPAHGLQGALSDLLADPGVLEGVILSTCNRTEVYAVTADPSLGIEALRRFAARGGADAGGFEARAQGEAVLHLMRVAAGLESQLLGEHQILAQIKEALAAAQHQRAAGAILDALFRFALSAGKRARSQTEIARGAVSVSGAAIHLAREHFGSLRGRAILILGSGKMGELAARHLAGSGLDRIYVASRTQGAARRLAEATGGEVVSFFALDEVLARVDVLVCCTGAPHHVLSASDLAGLHARRGGRELVLLDLSMPRNLDPAIADLPGMRLWGLDDLEAIARERRQERAGVVSEVEAILEEERAAYLAWLRYFQMSPAIASLRDKAHQVRAGELERFLDKYAEAFSGDQRRLIEELSQAIVNKLLHGPLSRLRGMSAQEQRQHVGTLQDLFDLPVEDFAVHYRRRLVARHDALPSP